MNISTVNELIASLESAGELSIKETKVMALAKAFNQLAAENVALKESRNNLAEFIHDELDADYPLNMNLETHATDRIVAGIKADGVEAFAAHLRANDNGASVCKMIALGADDFAKQLREGADK
ncbi:hypothetical protein [Klebsiella variicola]|uniref:hypothetical protein n=1 Tax=Klebsiella variicola TaxID=244366 RepID=UPI000E2A95EB|nr:hypothetical protein [Klebsiella variicola]SXE17760.1 Uncharacterised protein [Klebsiella variicola]HBW7352189.1 hypothetical protein [Klebsiella pneumoniae]